MTPEELDKQSKGLEGDPQVQAAAAGVPPAPPARKRTTVADLKKRIEEIEELLNDELPLWLKDHGTRLDAIDKIGLENLPSFISDSTERFEKLEMATRVLADAIHEAVEAAVQAEPAEPVRKEFDRQPIPTPEQQAQVGDIAAVASVCLTMNDVLMITRALKDAQGLSDMERNEILNIACQSADVKLNAGLQIRAGVRNVVA